MLQALIAGGQLIDCRGPDEGLGLMWVWESGDPVERSNMLPDAGIMTWISHSPLSHDTCWTFIDISHTFNTLQTNIEITLHDRLIGKTACIYKHLKD